MCVCSLPVGDGGWDGGGVGELGDTVDVPVKINVKK
jgi:hypothetical protein